jgi:putative methyltransferase (TIGR04325 family)
LEAQKAKWPQFRKAVQGIGPLGVAHEAISPTAHDHAAHNTIMAFGYVLALTAHGKERISLLDWGGGVGHYSLISRALLPGVEIDYHCKDVDLLCRGGRELVPDGSFHERDQGCLDRKYDLVLASGSLQYSEYWKPVVQRLSSAAGSYLYITRLPIVESAASFVVLQRPQRYGYQTAYQGWFLNRSDFLDHLQRLDMQLMREFLIQEKPTVSGAPEQAEYRGFLFRPRPSGT